MSVVVLETLWSTGTIRCVLVIRWQAPTHTVNLFDGARRISTEIVDGPDDALQVAALLREVFIGHPA
jgi:hypothetical protein